MDNSQKFRPNQLKKANLFFLVLEKAKPGNPAVHSI